MSAPTPNVLFLFGPLLLGVLLNTMFYGIMLVQTMIYYQRYKSDRRWFKYLVFYLLLIETVDLVSDVGIIFEPLILRYGTPEALLVSPVMLRADALLTVREPFSFSPYKRPLATRQVLISTPIQFFIAWRIYVVTRSLLLPAVLVILAIVSFGGGIATTTIVSLHPKYSEFGQFHVEVITWLVSSTICDVLLTASLVYSLWTRKTRDNSTDSYINKIIRLTVQTGSITAAAALLDMIFYLTLPNTSFNFMIDFPLSKLYTNALLSTLNARAWRQDAVKIHPHNALFEQTASTADQQRSFAMVAPRAAYQTPHSLTSEMQKPGAGGDAHNRNSKITLDIV
ncbi:hypothetical protein C8R46DRAFT_1296654 [Mycena filopes]|nr:hypothetical protein C8R46DRAFT_1296654 [Mycena filopes]